MRKIKKRIVAFLMTFLMVATSSLTMPPMIVNAENLSDISNVNIVNTNPFEEEEIGEEVNLPGEEGEDEEETDSKEDEEETDSKEDEEEDSEEKEISEEGENESEDLEEENLPEEELEEEDFSEEKAEEALPIEVYVSGVKQEATFADIAELSEYVKIALEADENTVFEFKLTNDFTIDDANALDFGDNFSKVSIDLNDKTLSVNDATLKVGNITANGRIENNGTIIADTLTMSESGEAFLLPESVLAIAKSAIIYNVYLGQDVSVNEIVTTDDDYSLLIKAADAEINLNGKIEAKNETDKLSVKTVDSTEDLLSAATAHSELLFTTDINEFPVDLINVIQPEEFSEYTLVSQNEDIINAININLQTCEDEEIENDTDGAPYIELNVKEGDVFVWKKDYETLQEALNAINSDDNKANTEYQIILNSQLNNTATSFNNNFSIPNGAKKITIESKMGDEISEIRFKDSLKLNSDLDLRKVKIASKTPKFDINLGGYTLGLYDVKIDNIKSITGNGVGAENKDKRLNTSKLEITASDITVNDNLNNVKEVSLYASSSKISSLFVGGLVNVGNIYGSDYDESKYNSFVATATVKKSGNKIISVDPKVTVNGDVTGYLDYYLKESNAGYLDENTIKSYSNGDEFLSGSGFRIMKLSGTFSGQYCGKAVEGLKNNGYLIYSTSTSVYHLYSFYKGDVGCYLSFSDVVSEINSRKDKNAEYHIFVLKNNTIPEPFTMPSGNNLNCLKIYGNGHTLKCGNYKNGVTSQVNKITLTSDTFISDVNFDNCDDKIGTPLTIAMSGKKLDISKTKFLHRAIIIDGGKKGALYLNGNDALVAGSEHTNNVGGQYNYIEGSLTNLDKLWLCSDSSSKVKLVVEEYVSKVDNKENKTFSQGALSAFSTDLAYGNEILVNGSINLTNIICYNKPSYLRASKDFNITGDVSLASDLYLIGYQKPAKAGTAMDKMVPYLNIKGNIYNSENCHLNIAVLDEDNNCVFPTENYNVQIATAPKASDSQLSVFGCKLENYQVKNVERYTFLPGETPANRGIAIHKNGNVFYAYQGKNIKTAVFDQQPENVIANEYDYSEALGFFPEYSDAVNYINSKNNKSADYTICLLNNDIKTGKGGTYGPLSIPSASKAKSIGIIGVSGDETISFTGSIIPSTDLTFSRVKLTSGTVKKNVFTDSDNISVSMTTGYNLTFGKLAKTTVMDTDNNNLRFGKITGSKGTLSMTSYGITLTDNSDNLNMKGTIHLANNLKIKQAVCGKSITIGTLLLDGDGYVEVQGIEAITINDIKGDPHSLNKLYMDAPVTDKGPKLKITGTVDDDVDFITIKLKDKDGYFDDSRMDSTIRVSDKLAFDATHKLAIMPKVDSEVVSIARGVNSFTVIKKGDGIYYTDYNKFPGVVRVSLDEPNARYSLYADWNDAVKAIDSLGNSKASYKMTVINDIGGDGNDADALVNGLTLPSKASLVTITSPWVNHIRFKGNAMNPKTDLIIEKTYFEGYKVVGSKCDKTNIDISIGNHAIGLIETELDANKISGCWVEVTDSRIDANNINVDVFYDYSSEITCKTLTTKLGASIEGGKIEADTMNLGQYVWFGSSPTLNANKITMGEVELESNVNVSVKTDKNGNSQLTVNGEVISEDMHTISVTLMKNGTETAEIMDDKTIIATAPKAGSEAFSVGTAHKKQNYATYKSKKSILYGAKKNQ